MGVRFHCAHGNTVLLKLCIFERLMPYIFGKLMPCTFGRRMPRIFGRLMPRNFGSRFMNNLPKRNQSKSYTVHTVNFSHYSNKLERYSQIRIFFCKFRANLCFSDSPPSVRRVRFPAEGSIWFSAEEVSEFRQVASTSGGIRARRSPWFVFNLW